MNRARSSLIVFLLTGITVPASAQLGVYAGEPQSLEEAERNRQGVRISGNVRGRAVPPTYTVRRGDTLWDVTGRYYGNPWAWPRVWSYNPEVTNPHWIYPLDQLRLLPPGEPVEPAPRRSLVSNIVRRTGEPSVFLQQQGYLDREALETSGVVVGSPDDHMLLTTHDLIYVEFGEDYPSEPRGEFTIFQMLDADERGATEEGTLVRIAGAVRIENYDQERHTARATIIDALEPIERGFRVAPLPRRFDLVPPIAARQDRETEVVATLREREIIGTQQLVFIPLGAEEGVSPGVRFFALGSGDPWRDELPTSARDTGASIEAPREPQQYPAEIVAEARVVHVRPHSATLMITRATRELAVGERLVTRQGY